MNRISLVRLRLAMQHGLAVKASPLGGWLVGKGGACVSLSRPQQRGVR